MNNSQKWKIIDLIKWADVYFKAKNFEKPRTEIELLIRSVLKVNRIDIYLNFDRILLNQELKTLKKFIRRRLKREPIQYIINKELNDRKDDNKSGTADYIRLAEEKLK